MNCTELSERCSLRSTSII